MWGPREETPSTRPGARPREGPAAHTWLGGSSLQRGRRWPWHSSCPRRLTNKVARNTLGVSGRKEGTGQSLGKTTNSPEKDKNQPELEADLDKG